MRHGTLWPLAVVLASAGMLTGCRAQVRSDLPPPTLTVETGFEPLYYRGHVVYYDEYGAPIYYVRGNRYYVPRTHRHYDRYVRHYREHRPRYREWHERHPPIRRTRGPHVLDPERHHEPR